MTAAMPAEPRKETEGERPSWFRRFLSKFTDSHVNYQKVEDRKETDEWEADKKDGTAHEGGSAIA